MVNEQTSAAIVLEIAWLVHGQEKKTPFVDEYGRKAFRFEHTAEPRSLRDAATLANERAKTWAFECSDVPPRPSDFKPA